MQTIAYRPNTQYTGLTGRRTNAPYNQMLLSQLPAARQAQADEALRLQNEEEFNRRRQLERKVEKAQEKQSTMDALIKTGNLALEVGKLTKDSWLPYVKEAGMDILGKVIPSFGVDKAAQIALNSVIPAVMPDVAQYAAPVIADAARETIAPIVAENLAPAATEALTGTVTNLAGDAASGAVKTIGSTLGSTLAPLAANISNYMTPWAAVASAAGKLGGWALEAIGENNDAPWVSLLGKTFQEAQSGGGVATALIDEFVDPGTADQINQTLDIFNPVGSILFDGKLSQVFKNAVVGPAKEGSFLTGTPSDLVKGVYNTIWGESDLSNAIFQSVNAIEPITGTISNLFGSIKKACIIVTACTHEHSPEVEIARRYRDKFLSQHQLRGYYMIAEKLVPRMVTSPRLTRFIKRWLVDPLIAYGRHALDKTAPAPGKYARLITNLFLGLIALTGRTRKQFTRANGEVI